MPSRRAWLAGLLLAAGWLLGGFAAHAQIVHAKPAQVNAANRRAQREAQRTDSPYKDSHLTVAPARLRRGDSTPHLPEGSKGLRYKKGNTPNAKPAGFLSLRRKKKD